MPISRIASQLATDLFLLLFASILMMALSEWVLRITPVMEGSFRQQELKKEFLAATKTHPAWGWGFVPGVDTTWNYSGREEQEILIRFATKGIPNYPRFGMRDDGLDLGKKLVVVLGDSYSFGATVELEDIWTEQIEKEYTNIDMLNLANGGGIAKSVTQYKELKTVLPAHDFVIYQMWLGNEFLDNSTWNTARGFVETENNLHRESIGEKLKRKSKLYFVANHAFERIRYSLGVAKSEVLGEYLPEKIGVYRQGPGHFAVKPSNLILTRYCEREYLDERLIEGVRVTEKALIEFRELAGEKAIVIIFPFKHQVHYDVIDDLVEQYQWELLKPNRLVLEMCRRHGIRCWDITDYMRNYRSEKLYWDYDPHFTPVGQFYAAKAVAEQMNYLGIISDRHPGYEGLPPAVPHNQYMRKRANLRRQRPLPPYTVSPREQVFP